MKSKKINDVINELYEEMENYILINWLDIEKKYINRRIISISRSVWKFRIKSLQIIKENPYNWNIKQRNLFLNSFWKKTKDDFFLRGNLTSKITIKK